METVSIAALKRTSNIRLMADLSIKTMSGETANVAVAALAISIAAFGRIALRLSDSVACAAWKATDMELARCL